jgi:hypothetical protein
VILPAVFASGTALYWSGKRLMQEAGFFASLLAKPGQTKQKRKKYGLKGSGDCGELGSSGSFPFDYAQGQDDSRDMQCKATAPSTGPGMV